MNHTSIQEGINQLAKLAEVEDVNSLLIDGIYQLDFLGWDIIVNLYSDDEVIYIFANIFNSPDSLLQKTMELIASSNLFGVETMGGHLGFNKETKTVVLSYRISNTEIDVTSLSELLGNFLQAATYWRDQLEQLTNSDKSTPTPLEKTQNDKEALMRDAPNPLEFA